MQGIYSVSGECVVGVKGVSGRFLDDQNLLIKGLLVLVQPQIVLDNCLIILIPSKENTHFVRCSIY